MKSITRNLLTAVLLLTMSWTVASDGDILNSNSEVQWQSFDWHIEHDRYFAGSTSREMLGSFQISGIPGNHPFMFSLSSPFSHIYEDAYDLLVHRNPAIASKVENSQRVTAERERVLRNIELSMNRNIIGSDNMQIIRHRPENSDQRIKGMIGFGMFHRAQAILIVDNPGSRFASLETLPDEFEKHAHFVPMKVESGYLVIPITAGNREIEVFFDGSSRPGLIMFGNRATRQVASQQAAPSGLFYTDASHQTVSLDGFIPQETLYFGNFPLGQHNVFRSNERGPSGIRGRISQPFFDDYLMIFDYKNGRFGIVKYELLSK